MRRKKEKTKKRRHVFLMGSVAPSSEKLMVIVFQSEIRKGRDVLKND